MKILVVTQYFWPENFKINDLCLGLVERGHEVTVYTGLPNYPDGEFFKGYSLKGPYNEIHEKIKIIRCPLLPRGKSKGLKLVLNYISFCLFATLLAPILVRGKFDKIFIYQLSPIFAALPAVLLKYIKRAPIILWVTDLWPESLEAVGIVKNKKILGIIGLFVKFIYKNSDKIYISSKGFSSQIESMGIDKGKIRFWPQWAESFFSEKKIDENLSDERIPDGFKLMFAGNIGSAQDFETIVEAAKILKDKKNIHFLILGDGNMKKWAEAEVKQYGIESTFHFLGRKPIESMPYYYSQADVMLVSLTDTFLFSITIPSKVQTYLASGKPIIASLNGEGASIINEWQAGYTCNATRPKELAECIERISLLPKSDLTQMGINAYKCYQSEFEREKQIDILVDEFKKLS